MCFLLLLRLYTYHTSFCAVLCCVHCMYHTRFMCGLVRVPATDGFIWIEKLHSVEMVCAPELDYAQVQWYTTRGRCCLMFSLISVLKAIPFFFRVLLLIYFSIVCIQNQKLEFIKMQYLVIFYYFFILFIHNCFLVTSN